ncbi:MAG TPA: hypothetical protein VFM80_05735 [Gracilimonas sp.]|uniref:hypothetical protein n=1 Tax=Gracilimonas sp. TaxID=1974203 RepID=UPI002D8D05AB|nr:hypothetical protein [Gracilimonas sp.]
MKRKEFIKSFAGAFIGVVVYQLFFTISDTFQNFWANYLTDIILMGVCVFAGILLIDFFINKFSLFSTEDNT